jgi:hypothetical protein
MVGNIPTEIMEFPHMAWEVLEADEFECAQSPAPSERPSWSSSWRPCRQNGRILNHFRLSTGGQMLSRSSIQLDIIIPAECLNKYTLHHQFWARDVQI